MTIQVGETIPKGEFKYVAWAPELEDGVRFLFFYLKKIGMNLTFFLSLKAACGVRAYMLMNVIVPGKP